MLGPHWFVPGSIKQTVYNFLQNPSIDRSYIAKISTQKFIEETIREFEFFNCYDKRHMALLKRYLVRNAEKLHEFAKNPEAAK